MKGEEYFTRVASSPPLHRLPPRVAQVLKSYLGGEKAISFDGRLVVNTHFPPFPGRAWDAMAEQMVADPTKRRLYSITLAVTNRCSFGCWHCYNAGRSPADLPLADFRALAARLQDLGAVMVTLTGGEPLLRDDLAEIVSAFDSRSCVIVGTTGWGLTLERARTIKTAGAFGMGISLDSEDAATHDRLRGRAGAHGAALAAIRIAGQAGLYPYVVTVASRELLERRRFLAFLAFARDAGALEVHLLEPCPVGRLAEHPEARIDAQTRAAIVALQREVALREDLPVLSTFTYLESADAFGCGAGITHLYVDGAGEVSPCNLIPLSFGNLRRDGLDAILERMARHFRHPRSACVGQILTPHVPNGPLPLPPDASDALCEAHLPREHALPAFFARRAERHEAVGAAQIAAAYDGIHDSYDEAWLAQAGAAVGDLIRRLALKGHETVFEAGCGSGYGTALLAEAVRDSGTVLAADVSEGMLDLARRRLRQHDLHDVEWITGDALEALRARQHLDAVVSTWVLGYIPLRPFFAASAAALVPGGRLAFVVHRELSPRREYELFLELVARDPTVLDRQVAFDFPRDTEAVRNMLDAAGFTVVEISTGSAVFVCRSAREVLDHLLRSGAGTAFYEAVAPGARESLEREFVARLTERAPAPIAVSHDYISCIARLTA